MHLTPENPEQFHTISALVLTFLLVVLALIGADWLNGYKRSIIPEDARLKTPQKAFQTFKRNLARQRKPNPPRTHGIPRIYLH